MSRLPRLVLLPVETVADFILRSGGVRGLALTIAISKRCVLAALLIVALQPYPASSGYLDEDPDQVFAEVYERLGTKIPPTPARDPVIWRYLSELKREKCDQTSVKNLSIALERLGYRREAGDSL